MNLRFLPTGMYILLSIIMQSYSRIPIMHNSSNQDWKLKLPTLPITEQYPVLHLHLFPMALCFPDFFNRRILTVIHQCGARIGRQFRLILMVMQEKPSGSFLKQQTALSKGILDMPILMLTQNAQANLL